MFVMFDRRYRKALLILALLLLSLACAAAPAPKNVIMMIGDGMGIGAITAARCCGPGVCGKLAMDTMPVTGIVTTHPVHGLVTDSAAAATALATGVKTNNGSVSIDPDGKRLRTILEVARELGKRTGVVSTKFITDATPAAFVAHVPDRKLRNEIAGQMIASRIDVILGGGKRYFIPKSVEGGAREDSRDLLADARKRGYDVFDSAQAMAASASERIIGLFASDSMKTERPEPTLAEMTSKAISTLAGGSNGFFLMSEGAKIDTEAHDNKADGVVKETLAFDEAVHAALDFAAKDGNTLVIVTADHDTGTLAVYDPENDRSKFKAGFVSNGHSGNMVLLYALGPGAQAFTGTHDNTDIPKLIAAMWGRKLN